MNHVITLLAAALAGAVDHQTTIRIGHDEIAIRNVMDDDGHGCTVVIDGQRLPTYGHNDLEAYRCGGLEAAGRLRSRGGKARIGLIYSVGGSPDVDFRTALVVERVTGKWRIEALSAGAHDDTPEARSITALRRWDALTVAQRQTRTD